MSVTKVNLVEADNLEEAEIPISFMEEAAYKNLNQSENSIAFCDIEQMKIPERPRAPVYVNKYPKGSGASQWHAENAEHAGEIDKKPTVTST